MQVPITGVGSDGLARTIDSPPGRLLSFGGSVTVNVRRFAYDKANAALPQGRIVQAAADGARRLPVVLFAASDPDAAEGHGYALVPAS
jgi:hypothetical protein